MPPERARLDAESVGPFVDAARPREVIVEGLTADNFRSIRSACRPASLVAALPSVFFEADIPPIRALLRECARANAAVEVNSWGGWLLAKRAGVRMESGPGLPVLNSLAVRTLAKAGMQSVTLSIEAARKQLERVAANCPLPCSLVVFGRPPLMISRVEPPDDYLEKTFADRRDTRVTARREGNLWVMRPVNPFDLRSAENQHLPVRRLVVDLVGSPNPLKEWSHAPAAHKHVFRFNYDRRFF
jgi:hypothetical protein